MNWSLSLKIWGVFVISLKSMLISVMLLKFWICFSIFPYYNLSFGFLFFSYLFHLIYFFFLLWILRQKKIYIDFFWVLFVWPIFSRENSKRKNSCNFSDHLFIEDSLFLACIWRKPLYQFWILVRKIGIWEEDDDDEYGRDGGERSVGWYYKKIVGR